MSRAAKRSRKIPLAVTIECWLFVASIVFTIWFFQSGTFEHALSGTHALGPVAASLISGAAFSTFVTTPLAIGGFASSGDAMPVWQIALLGTIGATAMDLLIVRWLRSPVAMLVVHATIGKDANALKSRLGRSALLRSCACVFGALLMAAPTPTDELGAVFFSASGLRPLHMIPLIFAADFFGIYALVSTAHFL
jgi:hypothetical protein